MRETDLSLEKAIKLCRITEQSKEQSKVFDSPTAQASSIDTVKKTRVPVETEKTDDVKRIAKCKFCGSSHNRGSCPAYGATCHKCNGRNHYARYCLKSRSKGLAKLGNIVAETLLQSPMFPSLAAREAVAEANFASWKQGNVFKSSQKHFIILLHGRKAYVSQFSHPRKHVWKQCFRNEVS